ncbi:hypothetical protein [Fontivita pretiosa]|uniref:hypothetical protein n=1 Tax=Fontivita pretiosa TaxID=2989684 RepID=UPI003D1710D4
MQRVSATTILLLAAVSCSLQAGGNLRQQPREEPEEDEELRYVEASLACLYRGLLAQDPLVIRAFLHSDKDPEQALVEAYTRRIMANMRFLEAVRKFEIGHELTPFEKYHIFLMDDVAFGLLAGNWEIRGDVATIPPEERMGDDKPPPPLIRVRGVWKINLTPTGGHDDARQLAARIDEYTRVLEQTTRDIVEGKLTTIDQIAKALEAAPPFAPAKHTPELILTLPAQPNR